MFKTLPDAIALAEFAHRHQVDKAGFPYIDHPKRVLAHVQAMGAAPYVQVAAVLHDVIEDTPFSAGMLLDLGFSPAAIGLVVLVSRKNYAKTWRIDDEMYYENINKSADARMIKIADITDNSLPWRTAYLPEDDRKRLGLKYVKARAALNVPVEGW